MAYMAMAQAVLEHAHKFYDVDNWYVVAECWDAWAVLEELDQHEEKGFLPMRTWASPVVRKALRDKPPSSPASMRRNAWANITARARMPACAPFWMKAASFNSYSVGA